MNAKRQITERPKKIVVNFDMLVWMTLFCCSVLSFRIVYAGRTGYIFLIWNLFLAWMPFLCALAAEHFHRRRANLSGYLIFSFLWLVFFPNAPYIVTDFAHLRPWPVVGVPFWFDFMMIASFAATGFLLGLCSLKIIERITVERLGSFWSWIFTIAVSLLAGFGIYLGRYLRWNSWDLILYPQELLLDILDPIIKPQAHPYVWVFSILFGALILFLYLVFSRFCDYRHGRGRA